MKHIVSLFALVVLLSGCASLKPGADPLVVRVEQVQSIGLATMDMAVELDHGNRIWWRSNAPGFHAFCEWLRTPKFYGTNTLPRGIAIMQSLDAAKMAYKSSRSSSNALITALAVAENAVAQSQLWISSVPTNSAGRWTWSPITK